MNGDRPTLAETYGLNAAEAQAAADLARTSAVSYHTAVEMIASAITGPRLTAEMAASDPNRWQAFAARALLAFTIGTAVGLALWAAGADIVAGPVAGATSAVMTGVLYRRAVRRWAAR